MDHLRNLRKQLHLTQKQLAARCGLPHRLLSDYETGRRRLTAAAAGAIAKELGAPDLIVGPEHYLPNSVARLFAPEASFSVFSRPLQTWADFEHQYWKIKQWLGDSAPDTLKRTMPCDVGSEGTLMHHLHSSGARLGLASPVLYGFDHHCLLAPDGRALGTRLWPCLYKVTKVLSYMLYPQPTAVGRGFCYRLDAIVLSATARKRMWSVLEVNGTGHNAEWDERKRRHLGLPILEFTDEDLHCLELAQRLEKSLLALHA